ncbi:spidroin-1-like [Phyllopteryx taeniolatus]|uniref:spidroin-1-like n=1 Tax=Phyllopteryx taeniolatus TaxID=161469 RepID=UPI002AD54562|nr:spidroin-1-like [Phyllopteryx taeniolatus]
MRGRLVFQCVLILWLAQSAHTGSYGAGVSGVPTSREAHFNGKRAHNGGGAGRRLIPLKGVGSPMGAQNGYGGYPNKGVGNGLAAGMANGAGKKGYSAANGAARAQGGWPQGYDGHAAPTNQHPMRGNGYSYHAGVFGAQGNKGNGYGGPPAGPQSGNKGYGGALGGKGAKPNGLAGAGRKPMKGYGQPYYGAGVGVSQIQGVPQLARNQGKAYGYNGYGTQPTGGSTGGYGMGLGPRYGSGGMKGPKPGYGGAAGVPNRQGAVPNGHGGTKCPVKPGYGIGAVPNGYGAKPNGYGAGGTKGYGPGTGNGAALGGFGNKLSGYGWLGAHSPPQTTKGVGPMLPGQGFGGFAGIPNQPAQAPNSRFVQRPYGNGPKIPGAPNGKGLKGGVLSPQQPGSAPWEGASPQRPIIEGDSLPAPEPTSGRLVLVTQDQYQKLPSPVPQGKLYMQPMPQATPVYAPVFPQGKQPKLGHKDSSGSAPMRPLDKSLKAPSYEVGPAGETPAALPQGKYQEVLHVISQSQVLTF